MSNSFIPKSFSGILLCMKEYNHKALEKKWQKDWDKRKIYKTEQPSKKKKFYILDMFPYPSGVGLHVGHPRGYIASDISSRVKRMQGFNVLHPMGYDAFGLPAEQYAVEHNIHPKTAVAKNVATFERQLSIMGLSYDWDRRVNTTDPEFYKWTQWIFLKIYNSWYNKKSDRAEPIETLIKQFEKDKKLNWKNKSAKEKQDTLMNYRLAYEGYAEVNWCPRLGTVLANDEVVDSKDGSLVSERGGYPVEKKSMRQWFMRITAYAEKLLEGLDGLDWSPYIKEIQRNWIGKKTGINISYNIENSDKKIICFTTRPDTNFGATFLVIGREHPYLENQQSLNLSKDVWSQVVLYKEKAIKNNELNKEKTGVFLGIYAINTLNNYRMPVYVSDYVIGNVGTGAVIGVPGHDKRDFEFAKVFNIPVVRVVQKDKTDNAPITSIEQVQEEDGFMVNSGFLNGVNIHEATELIMNYMVEKGYGEKVINYKMRDAIFARQRYWGEPIPLVYDKNGIIHPLKEKDLPLKLPNVKSYQPLGTGESPLAGVASWMKKGYETNTMPGWAGSSWYFLRYMDPKNKKSFADRKALKYWKDVDVYVGGAEHATGHLLYSRFWHKFLYDMDLVPTPEPFKVLKNQGLIGGADGRKMSKRWGNVINPDDIVETYGADTLRVYEMFMGPFDQSLPWSSESIIGSRRFLEKVWRLTKKVVTRPITSNALQKLLHKTIKKVTEDIDSFDFNTAISSMMIFVNEVERVGVISKEDFELFLCILAPFAPYITEEIWHDLGGEKSIHQMSWPLWDKNKIIDEDMKIVVQINGKVRAYVMAPLDMREEDIKEIVFSNTAVKDWIKNQEVKRVIYVKNRLMNIVI